MVGLLDLPVEVIQAILACLPADSLHNLFPTCRSLNYLSTSALLEHHGIRDPTNCTFNLDNPRPPLKVDALSALLAGLHIKRMKFLRCNIKTSWYWSWGWPVSQSLHRFNCLIQRLTSVDEVVLSFDMWGGFVLDDRYLKAGIDILQNMLNMIITKSCKALCIISPGNLFGKSYIFDGAGSGSNITQRFRRFVHRYDSPDWQYMRNVINGARLFLTCSPVALQNVALTRMQIDAMSLFTPPCSNWMFTMLKQSRIKSLILSLTWPKSGYTPAERSLILSRLAVAIKASVGTLCLIGVTHILETLRFIAQLSHLDMLDFTPCTWKAGPSDGSTSTSSPIVLNIKKISAGAEMLFFMFSWPLKVPKLKKIYLAFDISIEGMFDITTTATSIAQLRNSVGPTVEFVPRIYMHSVPPSMESLCNGVQPICPVWEQEFSKFTTLYLDGKMALLDSLNTFQIILGVLTLFSGLEELHIRLRPTPKVDPTPIHLEAWMVKAILNRSPNIASIFFNKIAQRIMS